MDGVEPPLVALVGALCMVCCRWVKWSNLFSLSTGWLSYHVRVSFNIGSYSVGKNKTQKSCALLVWIFREHMVYVWWRMDMHALLLRRLLSLPRTNVWNLCLLRKNSLLYLWKRSPSLMHTVCQGMREAECVFVLHLFVIFVLSILNEWFVSLGSLLSAAPNAWAKNSKLFQISSNLKKIRKKDKPNRMLVIRSSYGNSLSRDWYELGEYECLVKIWLFWQASQRI